MTSSPVIVWPFDIDATNDTIYGTGALGANHVHVTNGSWINTPIDLDLSAYGYPPFPSIAFQDALNSLYNLCVGPGNPFTVTISNEGYVSIALAAGAGAITIDANHASNTFDWSLVGFSTNDKIFPGGLAAIATSEWPAGCLFAPGWEAEYNSGDVEHFSKSSLTSYSGKRITRVHGSYYKRRVVWQAVHCAFVLNSRAQDSIYCASSGVYHGIYPECSRNTYENLLEYVCADSSGYTYPGVVHIIDDWTSDSVVEHAKGPYNVILDDEEQLTLVDDMSCEHYQIALNFTRTWTAP